MLSQPQVERFRRDGYLVVENAVSDEQLARMDARVSAWVQER